MNENHAEIHAMLEEAVQILSNSFPQRPSPETIGMYRSALDDLPPAMILRACKRLQKTSKWLPAISEIRQEVDVVTAEVLAIAGNLNRARVNLDDRMLACEDQREAAAILETAKSIILQYQAIGYTTSAAHMAGRVAQFQRRGYASVHPGQAGRLVGSELANAVL